MGKTRNVRPGAGGRSDGAAGVACLSALPAGGQETGADHPGRGDCGRTERGSHHAGLWTTSQGARYSWAMGLHA